MKKTFALILTAVMLLTLASCGIKDAGTLYAEAMEKTGTLEYMHAKINMDYSIEVSGVTMDMPMTIETRIHNSAEAPVMDMDMTVSMMGMEIATAAYYADNTAYTEAMGTKTKVTMDPAEFKKLFEESNEVAFAKEDFEGVEVTEEDGKYSFSTVISGEAYTEQLMESVMSGLMENLGLSEADAADMNITVSDIDLSVVINEDGYFEKYDMIFDMDITVSEELSAVLGSGNMKFHCDMKTEYINPGESFTIEAPADLDSYTEAAA